MAKDIYLYDGAVAFNGGVNSGASPKILPNDTLFFSTNATVRGGFIGQRPKYRQINLAFQDEAAQTRFETLLFQEAGYYRPDDINRMEELHPLIGGYQFRVIPSATAATATVEDITVAGMPMSTTEQGWMEQMEKWLVTRNGDNAPGGTPRIYDGTTLILATSLPPSNSPTAIPVQPGRQMAYSRGAMWGVFNDAKSFMRNDVVYSSSGTAAEQFRDAVLYFTPNTLTLNGGTFVIPGNFGIITALLPVSVLDTSMGEGPTQVFTTKAVFSVNVPVDISAWAALNSPIATVSLIQSGGLSQWSTVSMNGDSIFRAFDGIRSVILGRRDFETWGNTPISNEMDRVLRLDDPALLTVSSAVVFDNRLLHTCSPVFLEGHGVYHRGIAVLDNDILSSMRGKEPSVWDGMWTGLNVLKLVKGVFQNIERCFAFVLALNDPANPEIQLWEIMTVPGDDEFINGSTRVLWTFESSDFYKPTTLDMKKLVNGELWAFDMRGRVDFRVLYRPDDFPCWVPWAAWQECAPEQECPSPDFGVPAPNVIQPQYRTRMPFGEPPVVCDTTIDRPTRVFYVVQNRIEVRGQAKIGALRLQAVPEPLPEWGAPKCPLDAACFT